MDLLANGMSRSTPVCSLFCSRCKRESSKSICHHDRDHFRYYLNIIVVGTARAGNSALLKCKRCGYTYISNSAAARRALHRFMDL